MSESKQLSSAPVSGRGHSRAGHGRTGVVQANVIGGHHALQARLNVRHTRQPASHAIQRKSGPGVEAFQVPLRQKSGGLPLPDAVRAKMETAFGADFSDVRVHVGHEATSLGAIAYTWGSNIHFAPGQYNPNTIQGQKLLGHELWHVVQQRSGRVSNPFGGGVAVVQDHALEAEADRMGIKAAMTQVVQRQKHTPPVSPTAPPVDRLQRAPGVSQPKVAQRQIRPVIQRLIVKLPPSKSVATLEEAVDAAEVTDTVDALKAKTGQTNNDVVVYQKGTQSVWAWDAHRNYIVSHGTAQGGHLNGVYPSELAKALVANGLTNQAGKLKIVACYALEDRVSTSFTAPFVEALRKEGGATIKGLRVQSTKALVHYTPDQGKYLFSNYPQNLPAVEAVRNRTKEKTSKAISTAALEALQDHLDGKDQNAKPVHQDHKLINLLKKVVPTFNTTDKDVLKGTWGAITAKVKQVQSVSTQVSSQISGSPDVYTTFHQHKRIELERMGNKYWTRKKAALEAALSQRTPTPHKTGRKATSMVELEQQRYEEHLV